MIKLLMVTSLLVGLIGGGGGFVVSRWAPEWSGGAIWFSGAVNLAACWAAVIPIAVVWRWQRHRLPHAVMGATGIRLLVVTLALLAAVTYGPWKPMPLALWMMVFYFALLAVETGWTLRLLRSGNPTTHECAST